MGELRYPTFWNITNPELGDTYIHTDSTGTVNIPPLAGHLN